MIEKWLFELINSLSTKQMIANYDIISLFLIPKFIDCEKIYFYMNNRYRINKYLDLTYDINMFVFISRAERCLDMFPIIELSCIR